MYLHVVVRFLTFGLDDFFFVSGDGELSFLTDIVMTQVYHQCTYTNGSTISRAMACCWTCRRRRFNRVSKVSSWISRRRSSSVG